MAPGRRRRLLATAVLIGAVARPMGAQPGELIERTLAIVGGQVLTLSDVQTAIDLGLVAAPPASDAVAAAASRLVERILVLREVERYAPPEPAEADIDRRLADVRSRVPDDDRFARTLAAGGFTEARLRGWLRDDLRIASYLEQRFAAVSAPTDEEVTSYYGLRRAEFDARQLSFDAAAPLIRQLLTAERRQELIDDWIADLRRRTPVVQLW